MECQCVNCFVALHPVDCEVMWWLQSIFVSLLVFLLHWRGLYWWGVCSCDGNERFHHWCGLGSASRTTVSWTTCIRGGSGILLWAWNLWAGGFRCSSCTACRSPVSRGELGFLAEELQAGVPMVDDEDFHSIANHRVGECSVGFQ